MTLSITAIDEIRPNNNMLIDSVEAAVARMDGGEELTKVPNGVQGSQAIADHTEHTSDETRIETTSPREPTTETTQSIPDNNTRQTHDARSDTGSDLSDENLKGNDGHTGNHAEDPTSRAIEQSSVDNSGEIPILNFEEDENPNIDRSSLIDGGNHIENPTSRAIEQPPIDNSGEILILNCEEDENANIDLSSLIDGGNHIEDPTSRAIEQSPIDNSGEILRDSEEEDNANIDIFESSLIMAPIAEDETAPKAIAFSSLRLAKDRAKKALEDAKRRVATGRLKNQAEMFTSEMNIASGITSPNGISSPPHLPPGRLDKMMQGNSLDQYLGDSIRSTSGRLTVDSDDYTLFSEGELAEMTKGSFAVTQIPASEEFDHRAVSFIQFDAPAMQEATEETTTTTIQEETGESTMNEPLHPEAVSLMPGKMKTWKSPKIGRKKAFGSPTSGTKKSWKELLRSSPIAKVSRKRPQDPEGFKLSNEVLGPEIVPWVEQEELQPPPPPEPLSPASVGKQYQTAAPPSSPTMQQPLSQSTRTEASTVPSTPSPARDDGNRKNHIEQVIIENSAEDIHQEHLQSDRPVILTTMQIRQETRARQRSGPRPVVSGIEKNKIKPRDHKRDKESRSRVHRGNRRLAAKLSDKVVPGTGSGEFTKADADGGDADPNAARKGPVAVRERRRRSLDGATTATLGDNSIPNSPSRNRRAVGQRRPITSQHRKSRQDAKRTGSRLSPTRHDSDRTSDRGQRNRAMSADRTPANGLIDGQSTSMTENHRTSRRGRISHSPVPRGQRRNHSDHITASPQGAHKASARRRPRGGTWGSERDANGEVGATKPVRRRGSRGSQLTREK